jgi:hypothetical protein
MLGLALRRVFLQTSRRTIPLHRSFAAAAGLPRDQIEKRVISVLKGSERVDPTKVRIWHRYSIVDPVDR